ncbi:hypothetical protein VIGAN_11098300, partial [Vigna angularis var. angularis]
IFRTYCTIPYNLGRSIMIFQNNNLGCNMVINFWQLDRERLTYVGSPLNCFALKKKPTSITLWHLFKRMSYHLTNSLIFV